MNRRTAVASLGLAVVSAAAGAAGLQLTRPGSATPPAAAPRTGTATVMRTDLAARQLVAGVLGFAGEWRIEHPGPSGVLTAVAPPASMVARGQRLYEVDGRPVCLLYGKRPVWRSFVAEMPAGEDVHQLESNLAALGLGSATVDTHFTARTADAVRRLQARLGVARAGRLELGSVVFAPEALRVAQVLVPLGGRVGGGPVLRATSSRRVVSVALETARQGDVAAGSTVLVTLPNGDRVPGTVADVGRVAAAASGSGGPPTVLVTITLDDPSVAGVLDQAPVQVAITTDQRHGVLAVPVTALVGGGGGYQVIVVDGDGRRPVPVRPGLFDELSGRVEVSGDDLAQGVRVEVPMP